MKLFYNPSGTVKVLPVSVLPVNAVWNGGFPYTPEGSLLVSIVSAKPTDTVSNGGFIQELWGGVCAGYDTPSIWIGGLAITSYGALCLDVDGGIVTDGPVIYNSLTNSLIPTRGSLTPSFTRATTATFTDWEGVLRTVPSGCARFEGARMVRNLATNSETLTVGGGWSLANISNPGSATVVAPDGTTTAWLFTATANFGQFYKAVTTMTSGGTQCNSLWLRRNTGTGTVKLFDKAGGYGATVTLTSEWARFEVATSGAGTGGYCGFELGTSGDKVEVWHPQLEDVTGQADQTASEYVSVGVESAPAYHGSMVDGVKCYDTDRSGNPISTSGSYPLVGYVPWPARTNVALQGNAFTTAHWAQIGTLTPVQNAIGPDGATSAWTFTDDNAAATEARYQPITLTAATYTMHVLVGKTTGAQSSYPVLQATDLGTKIALCTVDTTNGVATVWTAYTGFTIVTSSARCESYTDDLWKVSLTFLATAAAWYHYLQPAATANATQATGVPDAAVTGSAVFCNFDVELGSFATPYIPTTTVAVARNADVDQYPTTAGPIAAAGTVYLDFTPYHAPSGTIALWGTYVDASNYTAILHDATNLIFRKRIAGSNYDATIANAFASGTTYKVAATWGTSGTAIYLDGVAGTPHANTTAAQIAATMQVGADGNSLQQPGAGTTNLRIWQRQLSAPEGVAVTA